MEQIDIDKLVNDREAFNKFVYTPIDEAVNILKENWQDKNLELSIEKYLNGNIPKAFENGFKISIFRHITTPNYELNRFLNIVDALDWAPLLGEYTQDKFISNNISKYSLARLSFHYGYGRNGGDKIKYKNVIDFNENGGKKFSEIKTIWGQSLVDFHHEIFFMRYPNFSSDIFFDASKWFHDNGGDAKEYYKKFLALFIRNGILFENFLLEEKEELIFAKEYFLPAFIKILQNLGKKPLIVALEPTTLENELFWVSYPPDILTFINHNKK